MKKIILIFSAALLIISSPDISLAVDVNFDSAGNQFLKGEDFEISVEIDAGDEVINAIEGEINFPEDLLQVVEIRDGSTMVNFWLERPKLIEGNIVRFSGLTPGGFTGADNNMFSVVLRAENKGYGIISAQKVVALRNDGSGTKAPAYSKSLPVLIEENLSYVPVRYQKTDTELPETFTPIISQSPEIFDGKYFLVFATQDKMSGIDYYEVKEGNIGSFRKTSSPYLLKDQNLTKRIYVKAVDKAGNERIEIVEARNSAKEYPNYNIFVILLILLAIFVGQKIWTRYIKS